MYTEEKCLEDIKNLMEEHRRYNVVQVIADREILDCLYALTADAVDEALEDRAEEEEEYWDEEDEEDEDEEDEDEEDV